MHAAVSEEMAINYAALVKLENSTDLKPCMIFHASRLVAILEAYALHDEAIGYCQGMSYLLSPILAIIEDDSLAFWCFVGFMRKARENFRSDEVGIKEQLEILSRIIQVKDPHLHRHILKLGTGYDFVYSMVVVLLRKELDLEQVMRMWEVMWAEQTTIRLGLGRINLQAPPPTDHLHLYAIAYIVLQKKSMIEACHTTGELWEMWLTFERRFDVCDLLEKAHDLVAVLGDAVDEKMNLSL